MGIINRIITLGWKGKNKVVASGSGNQARPYFISFGELSEATNNFDENNVIGRGGFGNVYWGILTDGTTVAVKRKKLGSEQGEREFYMEINLLSNPQMKHSNLVSLIGYCNKDGEMILVYEYVEKGTLKSHLYGSGKPPFSLLSKPPLSWEERVVVSVGAARGLNHLHTIPPNGIIHRDIKSENILLDENLGAKIADFGLAKAGPDPEMDETHVSTIVKGTLGYLDPEYWKMEQVTKKTDVYSFGVVLLEILCGRRVIDKNLSADKVSLVEWGKKMLEERKVEEIVDKNILGTTHPFCLTMFGNIVLRCLAEVPAERPTMEEVLKDLEWELNGIRAASTSSSTVPAAEDESDSDHVVPSQPIISHGNGKALQRSEGKIYKRAPGFGELDTISE